MNVEREPKPAPTLRSFRELAGHWQEKYPDTLHASLNEQKEYKEELQAREDQISSHTLREALDEHGINSTGIQEDENGHYILPRPDTSNVPVLPDGYAYKGGAARTLLREALGLKTIRGPRDLDVIRLAAQEPYPHADREISKRFMPEDYEHGDGVEPITDIDQYLNQRDLTINEVLATNTEVIATEQAILDTARNIIRMTNFEHGRYDNRKKMTAKILRFYAQAIVEFEQETYIESSSTFERSFIPPFWAALHLDRAYSHSPDAAEEYVAELVRNEQLPETISSPEEAAEYLNSEMLEWPFHFRHADLKQFNVEDDWIARENLKEDDLYKEQDRLEGLR